MITVLNSRGQPTKTHVHDPHCTINDQPALLIGGALFVASNKSGWCLDGLCSTCRWAGCGCVCHGEVS